MTTTRKEKTVHHPAAELGYEFASGWASGACGILLTHPLDTLRVKVQTIKPSRPCKRIRNYQAGQPRLAASANPTSYLQLTSKMYNSLGLKGFFRGVIPPVLFRGGSFAALRATKHGSEKVFTSVVSNRTRTYMQQRSFDQLLLGTIGGVVGIAIETPIHFLKVKGQVNKNPAYKETITTTLQRARRIMRGSRRAMNSAHLTTDMLQQGGSGRGAIPRTGLKALFTGFVPGMGLAPSWGLLYFAYDKLRKENVGPVAAGALSAICSWPVFYPFDVIRARMHTDRHVQSGLRNFRWHAKKLFRQPVRYWFPALPITLARAVPRFAVVFFTQECMDKMWNSR